MRAEDLAANLILLKREPADPSRHDTVAIFYLQSGQPEQAIVHFRESIRLKPDAAPPHYNLGPGVSGDEPAGGRRERASRSDWSRSHSR
jgi:hypothetical protein